ncbi:MAG: cation:proton antiporter [Elusimicrobia bacterium]|nr:cation:proton antiporter [Elusimicrobiota bacterium]
MSKQIAAYVLALVLFAAGLQGILHVGARIPAGDPAPAASAAAAPASPAKAPSHGNPLSLLLLQIVVVICASRVFGKALAVAGQPEVVGEILAGICLGPSLLGAVWPHSQAILFPPGSLDNLSLMSNFGLVVFMFIVGIELSPGLLRERAATAVWISHASIIVPFLMGSGLALFLYPQYAPKGVAFPPFCLFMGTAMSITAFPVLARIIREKGLTRSPIGAISLACAAVDDVTAWCALAAVVGYVQSGSALAAVKVAGLCAMWIGAMVWIARPALARWIGRFDESGTLGREATATALLVALVSALVTERIGVHALFGAFLAGVLMPPETGFRQALAGYLERFTVVVLLPLFFTLTGLRTRIGLLDDPASWAVCALILLVAVTGKFGGSSLAARWSGMGWRDSLAVGTLMNTRGLIELVVLNIGYDLGVITPSIFAMMVLMAIATTVMAGPGLALLGVVPDRRDSAPEPTGSGERRA